MYREIIFKRVIYNVNYILNIWYDILIFNLDYNFVEDRRKTVSSYAFVWYFDLFIVSLLGSEFVVTTYWTLIYEKVKSENYIKITFTFIKLIKSSSTPPLRHDSCWLIKLNDQQIIDCFSIYLTVKNLT